MKKEKLILAYSIVINIIVSILKIVGGMFFNSYTLIADGYYTVCDLITDFIAIIGSKISKRRANKRYPFGFGKVEYLTQMIIGLLIFLTGVFVIYKSFFHEFKVPNLNILYLVFIVILLKVISSNLLMKVGKELRSQMLIISSKESFIDVISSIIVFIIIVVGKFLPVIDFYGSIFVGLLIIYNGLKIITESSLALVGEDDNNKEIKKYIKDIIDNGKYTKFSDITIMKNGFYYQVFIEMAVDDDITVNKLLLIENRIRRRIKKGKHKIKFIEFDIIKM